MRDQGEAELVFAAMRRDARDARGGIGDMRKEGRNGSAEAVVDGDGCGKRTGE